MGMQRFSIQAGRRTGSPFAAGPYQVTPEAIGLTIHWGNFGYVWNWPVAVSVSHAAHTERIAIVDPTRQALWAMWLLTAVTGLIALTALLKPRRPQHE